MSDSSKITAEHRRRSACVYVRQSTNAQVEHHRESTERQYQLVERAVQLGWSHDQVRVVDEDLGVSGAGLTDRSGFAHLTAQVALGHVGLVLGLEVSRLARNNADWYRLLDLCGATDTLIGDADGIYHPALFNDRLLLGLKGTMSEAELHVLRARLEGGIRNKAARGELRRGLPVGLVWGDAEGEIRFHPDESVTGAIRAVFERFAEMGSARRVWLWLRSQGLQLPMQSSTFEEIRWVAPTYTKIHQVLTNPVYAGAYVYGKKRHERYVDDQGRIRKRARKLPRSQWSVLLRDHHPGFIDWQTFEQNQARLASNTRPRRHESGGAVREGAALLQGIATCGRCGRRLRVYYSGRHGAPGYHCPGQRVVNGRGEWCLRIGGHQIDRAVASAFLSSLAPAGLQAARCWRRSRSSRAATRPWPSASKGSSARATRRSAPSATTAPWIPTTAWSPAAWRPSGRSVCTRSRRPRPSSRNTSGSVLAPSAPRSAAPWSRWAPISNASGRRPPPPIATARSCCARCSRRLFSTWTETSSKRI